jgi:hypothetical protein
MLIFGNDLRSRGCYREIMDSYTIGAGAYLTLPDRVTLLPNPARTGGGATYLGGAEYASDPYLITSINFAQKEKYHIVQCFNNRNYTYAFGHDPLASMVEISLTVFLTTFSGSGDDGTNVFAQGLQTLTKHYRDNRLSKQPQYAVLTMDRFTLEGFIVGMSSNTIDQEHNMQSFTLMMILVEAQHD